MLNPIWYPKAAPKRGAQGGPRSNIFRSKGLQASIPPPSSSQAPSKPPRDPLESLQDPSRNSPGAYFWLVLHCFQRARGTYFSYWFAKPRYLAGTDLRTPDILLATVELVPKIIKKDLSRIDYARNPVRSDNVRCIWVVWMRLTHCRTNLWRTTTTTTTTATTTGTFATPKNFNIKLLLGWLCLVGSESTFHIKAHLH